MAERLPELSKKDRAYAALRGCVRTDGTAERLAERLDDAGLLGASDADAILEILSEVMPPGRGVVVALDLATMSEHEGER